MKAGTAEHDCGYAYAVHARTQPGRRRPEPAGDHRQDPTWASRRRSGAWRTAPTPRSPESPTPPTAALPSSPRRSVPPRSQIGTAVGGCGRRQPPALPAGQGLPCRSLQGRAAEPRRRHPRRSPGPYDLGNVVVRAAPQRRPGHRPGHARSPIRCRRSSKGFRCDCASIRVNLDRPEFTYNPTNCDPACARDARSRVTKGVWRPRRPPSMSPTAPTSPTGRS